MLTRDLLVSRTRPLSKGPFKDLHPPKPKHTDRLHLNRYDVLCLFSSLKTIPTVPKRTTSHPLLLLWKGSSHFTA